MLKITSVLCFLVSFVPFSYAAWSEYDRGTGDVKVTLSSVTNRIRVIIDDPNSANGTVRYSSATIYDLINTASRLFCIQTQALTAYATQQITACSTTTFVFGANEYTLPDDILFLNRVTIDLQDDNGHTFIPQKTVWSLDLTQGNWAVSTSSAPGPSSYYLRNNKIGLYPRPVDDLQELAIWYIKYPALMTAEGDVIFDNYTQLEPYWEALAAYSAYHILIMEGKLQLAGQYAQIWTQILGLAGGTLIENPNSRGDTSGATFEQGNR